MHLGNLLTSLAAGVAAFLVVTAAVTELAFVRIEFSLFVGLPVGLLAGGVVAAGIYLGMADEGRAPRQRVALALGVFGAVFLFAVVLGTTVAALSVVSSFALRTFAGVVGAILAYVIGIGTTPDSVA